MRVENRDDVTILRPEFGLDAINAPHLKEAVQEIAQTGGVKLLIDMEKTFHIDSSGLLALLRFRKVLQSYQGQMKIARAHPQVLNIIQLTGLNELFEIHDTLENALKSFD
jgi:anti-sigma B factor antagonist